MDDSDRYVNLSILSAQGLKDVCTFAKMSPYAEAWIDPSSKQRTSVAANAGCTPVWPGGHNIHLSLPQIDLRDEKVSLSIQIWNRGSVSDTLVGSANLPLCDLLRGSNGLEFIACQLLRPSGRVQGLVNFSLEIPDNVCPAQATCKDSQDAEGNYIPSSSIVSGASTAKRRGSLSDDQKASQGQDTVSPVENNKTGCEMELEEPVKRSGVAAEVAPDAVGVGRGLYTSSDLRGLKPAPPVTSRASSAPDALDLKSHGDGNAFSNGSARGSNGLQSSAAIGYGGLMLGGGLGALLLVESANVKGDVSAHVSGSDHGVAGSSGAGGPAP